MKLINKKISLGVGLAVLFLSCSIVYSIGYKVAMDKFNSLVSSTQEKQKLYGNLSEVDYNIRNYYIGNIEEEKIFEGIYSGYISNLEDCKFFNSQDYVLQAREKRRLTAEVSWDEINDSIGYLRCKTLGNGFSQMFTERMEYFISRGKDKVIIDLRLSEKGLVQEVFKALQSIISEGDIVFAVSKNGEKEVVCKSGDKGISAKITVIVGENCSAASEVLASALKDSLGAKIVGKNTKGNLFREKTVQISENSIIIFPDAKYITAGGKDLYKKGLIPDETVELGSEEKQELLKNEKLAYEDDPQLQTAINTFSN